MRTVFYIPPLTSLSGGLANIYETALNLQALGADVALMGPSPGTPGFAEAMAGGLPALPWGTPLTASDTWCIPESWPNVLSLGVDAGARVLVYAQNWVYLFGNLPEGVRWRQLPLNWLAVSQPVAWFLREVHGIEAKTLLPPVISEPFFLPADRPAKRVRVAFMPRKNRPLAMQIRQVAEARLDTLGAAPKVEWLEIRNLSREKVAEALRSSHIFLSTGFPEGFGLPPLEAMASGCVPLGFTGFGGWEYMRQATIDNLSSSHAPPFALEKGEGNGFFFADGDTLTAGLALAQAIRLAHENSPPWQKLTEACRRTAARYTRERQREALKRIFLS